MNKSKGRRGLVKQDSQMKRYWSIILSFVPFLSQARRADAIEAGREERAGTGRGGGS